MDWRVLRQADCIRSHRLSYTNTSNSLLNTEHKHLDTVKKSGQLFSNFFARCLFAALMSAEAEKNVAMLAVRYTFRT